MAISAVESRALNHVVRRFNTLYPIGTAVRYWPGVREGLGISSHTKSEAFLLAGHTPCVFVDGRGDCIALTHVCAEAQNREEAPVVRGGDVEGCMRQLAETNQVIERAQAETRTG